MSDIEYFDVLNANFQKEIDVTITATSDSSPQTVATMTTPSLPAGEYMVGYSFQATHGAKNAPLYFRVGGDLADVNYFNDEAGDTSTLNRNRYYAYPKTLTAGALTISLQMYEPGSSGTVLDFVDLIVYRIA